MLIFTDAYLDVLPDEHESDMLTFKCSTGLAERCWFVEFTHVHDVFGILHAKCGV